ncbi:MAG: TRAP transporter large permease subunit [Treponema sp.]|nr:TRAP transporter large permease subunit [Treponema sp.]
MNIRAFSILKTASLLEKGICFGSLIFLALIPLVELLLRQFGATISGARSIIQHLFLVVGFFTAMLTAQSGEHITISTIQFIKNEKLKQFLQCTSALILVFILTILVWNSVSYIKYSPIALGWFAGPVPVWVFAIAMPLGLAVIALRFILRLEQKRYKIPAIAAIIAGTAAALPAIAKIIWGFEPPEPFYSWVNILYDAATILRTPTILFLIFAAFFGLPIFASICGIAMIMLQSIGQEPEAASIQIFDALTKTDIIAIPLFTLTGFLLSESNAGERLVRTFRLYLGRLSGGLIIAAVLISAFFTSFTGASGITILALGGLLYKILTDNGYSKRFSIGLLTSAGGVGLMFMPSLPIILVWSMSGVILHFMSVPFDYSFVDFFLGALIPGIILVLAMIAAGFTFSKNVKVPTESFDKKEATRSLLDSGFEIFLPVILIAGLITGFFTLLEASAVSVVYVLVVELFIKKGIVVRDIPKIIAKAVPIIGGVLLILAMAQALSYAIVSSGIPENFSSWMQGTVQSKFVFLLLLNFALLFVGCVMDIFSAILVILPLVIPLGYAYGIDPVHLGIIFLINLEAGFLTPPMGMNLFLASYRFEQPFMRVARYIVPYLIIRLAIVLLVTYIPWLTTWLPGLFK